MGLIDKSKGRKIRGFYRLNQILKRKALYNIIMGQKSNGKTYSVLEYILKDYLKTGNKAFYIRRWQDDLLPKNIGDLFKKGKLLDLLKGTEWETVDYMSGRFYLAYYDEKGKIVREPEPFMYTGSLNAASHLSGTRFDSDHIATIFFDEFLTRSYYLVNEFVIFQHLISDIVRENGIATIFMVGNTVDWSAPYFREMYIDKAETMELGEIRVYDHGKGTTIAIEYADSTGLKLSSNKYFAGFDNPAMRMITHGDWEIPMYPHLPEEYHKHVTRVNVFIKFGNKVMHGDVFEYKGSPAVYFHEKTSEIRLAKNRDIVMGEEISEYFPQVENNLLHPRTKVGQLVLSAIQDNRCFYQDNFCGEYVNNYLKYCHQIQLIK